jgi:hypothetical protein
MFKRRINQSTSAQLAPIDINNALPASPPLGNQIHSRQLWSILTVAQQQALYHHLVSVSCALVNHAKNRSDSEEASDEQH